MSEKEKKGRERGIGREKAPVMPRRKERKARKSEPAGHREEESERYALGSPRKVLGRKMKGGSRGMGSEKEL